MSQLVANRPREITVAAMFAIIGGSLFVLAGVGVAGTVGYMVLAISHKYQVSLRNAGPDFREIMEIFAYLAAIPLLLGIVGLITGRGLLRMKPLARLSAISWAIGSTLACFYFLAHPTFKSGLHLSATAITLLMLFLLPINTWWLFLFLRPSTRELFGPSGVSAQRMEVIAWLKKDRLARYVIATVAAFAVVGGAGWMYQRNSSMKEVIRCRDALAAMRSWHFHTVRYIPGLAPETIDVDTVCPLFQRRTASYQDAAGLVQTRDSIYYFGNYYSFFDGRWQPAQHQAGFADPGIFECKGDPTNGNENSLPLAGVIEDGSAKRGELVDVNGESCREYAVSVATPHDPTEKEFHFTICISERDHLPREIRRTAPGATHEGVCRFSRWNTVTEPQLPPDFPK